MIKRAASPRVFAQVACASFTLLATACGGTSETERGAGPVTEHAPEPDHGGRPADCSAEDGLDFWWIEDFETGAATGWYTNTDVCKTCNDADGDLSDLNRPLGCLLGEGFSEAELSSDPDGLSGTLVHRLREEDPEQAIDTWNSLRWIRRIATGPGTCEVRQVLENAGFDTDDLSAEEQLDAAADLLLELTKRRNALIGVWESCGLSECLASQTPTFLDKPLPAEQIKGKNGGIRPRCASHWAMHIETHVTLQDFGGTFGRSFSTEKPLDLRGDPDKPEETWDGVAFWARSAPGTRNVLKVSVPESHTDEKYEVNGKPVCYFDSFEDDTTQACDKHGSWVTVTEDWKLYKLPFREMRQAGWGKPAAFFDLSRVTGLGIEYAAGRWDLWFDDIGFYRDSQ
jgi:hypothetical protein